MALTHGPGRAEVSIELQDAAETLLIKPDDSEGIFTTNIPGLILMRASKPTRPQCILYRPALCLIVQGGKEMAIGESRATYREGQSIVITQDMPTLVHITEASTKRPFVGLGLELDTSGMREVAENLTRSPRARDDDGFQLFVEETSRQIKDCIIRLIQAANYADGLAILQPSVMREVYYWLLTGPNGERIVRQMSITGSAQRIAGVVQYLRHSFKEPIMMEQLAEMANMSPSSFYEKFKAVTSISPLQFQKQLRLTESRRLLLTGGVSVADAAYQVGYESSSQFSREYSRMFGIPPTRDTSFFYENMPHQQELNVA